ncbi:MAG TPA: hypothetical protein VFJ16_14710 [Longimicrobium sp.]|nr:hypothetical protein [Longimicrobium sp.]
MNAAIPKVARVIVLALAASIAACSDAGTPVGVRTPERARMLAAGSTETLASGLNLTNGSSVSWNVSMPSYGTIRLSFDARINYGSTAGNSTIFDIKVNGVKVTSAQLYNKGATYTYPNRSQTESYYANRGSSWGQADSLWGLFWSPNFSANNTSSNTYYVQGGNAYTYVLTITGLVNLGQVNTIEMVNQGAWVQTATGNSPTIVLQNVKVQSIVPQPLSVGISASFQAPPNQTCWAYASVSGGTPPYSYQWYVNGAAWGNGPQTAYTNYGYGYTLGLLVTDALGTTQGASQYVDVWSGAYFC